MARVQKAKDRSVHRKTPSMKEYNREEIRGELVNVMSHLSGKLVRLVAIPPQCGVLVCKMVAQQSRLCSDMALQFSGGSAIVLVGVSMRHVCIFCLPAQRGAVQDPTLVARGGKNVHICCDTLAIISVSC